MDHLQVTFPNYVKIITIGKSYEGRDLKVIKISSGRFSDGSAKPAAWIDGGKYNYSSLKYMNETGKIT